MKKINISIRCPRIRRILSKYSSCVHREIRFRVDQPLSGWFRLCRAGTRGRGSGFPLLRCPLDFIIRNRHCTHIFCSIQAYQMHPD
ncbi:hypothetical protein AB6A40_006371 [Gnathostoma spinigerum]|uniref:Uncharacterized protein n=1 Tax=Gnathostoma spinigerum TaxID=75299 RepID=A0ABD6EKE2_9BILA